MRTGSRTEGRGCRWNQGGLSVSFESGFPVIRFQRFSSSLISCSKSTPLRAHIEAIRMTNPARMTGIPSRLPLHERTKLIGNPILISLTASTTASRKKPWIPENPPGTSLGEAQAPWLEPGPGVLLWSFRPVVANERKAKNQSESDQYFGQGQVSINPSQYRVQFYSRPGLLAWKDEPGRARTGSVYHPLPFEIKP